MFRIGFGFDVHQLVANRNFCLGGIIIPYNKGTLGHSDGDALIHAICDALLGAAALGDIGLHFPDTSEEFKDIDSKILLKKSIEIITKNGFSIGNIDATVCLQKPKIAPYIPDMIRQLSIVMDIPENSISIKATTAEKMGFVGEEKGIAVYAVVLINK
jgi:2-C-methyl-D-erythritol 2,4-cyclodiphosphate synthase